MKEKCFHCGLPVLSSIKASIKIFDKLRYFCCPGCEAVAKTIINSGMDDFYRFREQPNKQNSGLIPDVELLEKLSIYDHPEVQKTFVRHNGKNQQAGLILENIHCAACLWLNEQYLRKLAGVLDVTIDYSSQQAWVKWDPEKIKLSEILRAITEIGYIAHPFDPVRREKLLKEQYHRSAERLLFALLLMMPVMSFSIAGYWMGNPDTAGDLPLFSVIGRWSSLIVITVMLGYSGLEFFAGAWRDLSRHQVGMDIPIVLGLGTAYVGSFYSTAMQSGDVYFDSISMFIVFVLIARVFELRGRMLSANTIDRMLKIIPRTVSRLTTNNKLETVAVVNLEVGHKIRLQPGESVPVDGKLLSKVSSFDESLLTGESRPVVHYQGETVLSGTCNIDQPIDIEVVHTVQSSTLAEIHELVSRGLKLRPHYALLAERTAHWFVIAVLLIALMTAIFWLSYKPENALANIISVLIISCPCALALATPVALAIAAGHFSDANILPLRMSALEPLSKASMIAFDKTGTLTLGKPVIVHSEILGQYDSNYLLQIAAALEMNSEHPIAHSFRNVAKETGVADSFQAAHIYNQTGQGISGQINGQTWYLGTPGFALQGITLAQEIQEKIDGFVKQGCTVVMLANEHGGQAFYILEDTLRENVKSTLSMLKANGIQHFAIISGDHSRVVNYFAEKLGISNHQGDMSPADKLEWIRARQSEGYSVIMVGDGINDAPTLTAADSSISFGNAANLAQQVSDFVIMGNDFSALQKIQEISQQTRQVILQNLGWAVVYNLFAIPAAAAGLIPPWGAAIGMSLSSLLVVSNAMRLFSRPISSTMEKQVVSNNSQMM